MRLVALALTFLMLLASPAAAGTAADPEVSDACDVGVVEDTALPWLDICGVWFETLSAPSDAPEIKITMEVAGDVAPRVESTYYFEWEAGGCSFIARRVDVEGTGVGDTVVRLTVQCDPTPTQPCPVPVEQFGVTCFGPDNTQEFDISDGYAESGNRVSWTLRFDGALAPFAAHHAQGSTLQPVLSITNASGLVVVTGDQVDGGRAYVVGS